MTMDILTKRGTKSLLFGCHQFILHPIFVFAAWIRLYDWPHTHSSNFISLWHLAFVWIMHDWGYWGCETMDGPCGDRHAERGAHIIRKLTGSDCAARQVLYHSRFYAASVGKTPGMLCWADKLGTALYPSWLWATLAMASGEGKEYMENSQYEIHRPGDKPTWRGLYRFHKRLIKFTKYTQLKGML